MKKYFKMAKDNLKLVTHRFPLVLIICVAAGIFAMILVHETFDDFENPTKVLMGLVLFALTSLSAKMAYECYEKITKVKYIIMVALGGALAAAFGLFWINFDFQYTAVRYAAIVFALIILFFAVPYLGKRRGSENFTNKLGWRLVITGLYTGILIGGLCALFFAIEELLNVNLIDEIYADIAIIVVTVFSPMFFLAGVGKFEEYAPNKLYKVLMVYILMPLLLAYTAVVYAYIIRIVFNNFEMPGGIVGNLVLWYSFVGVWVMYLSKDYLKEGFGKFFNKFYPYLSIVPIITMFIALYLRINQYGITANRYFSLIGGMWIFGMILFYIFTKIDARRNVVIVASLTVIAILTVVGPWSAGAVSLRSQTNRLEQVLVDEGVLVDGELIIDDKITMQTYDIYRYIDRNHGFDKVDFLNDMQISVLGKADVDYAYVSEEYPDGVESRDRFRFNENFDKSIDISGYDFMVNLFMEQDQRDITDSLYYRQVDDYLLELFYGGELNLTINLQDYYSDNFGSDDYIGDEYEDFVVIASNDDLEVKLVLQNLEYEVFDDEIEINMFSGILLVKIK